jgi:mRNA interferase RelE/StbE
MAARIHVRLKPQAQKGLHAAPANDRERLVAAIDELRVDARPRGTKPIGDGFWRLRVGGWRIVYTIDDAAAEVTVWLVSRRANVYRQLAAFR